MSTQILSSYELLQSVVRSQLTNRDTSQVREFYSKGWSEGIADTIHTIGCITFDEITLPSANESLQISSTDAGDTGGAVIALIVGLDSTWNTVQETIALTGQTPATLTNQYFRITTFRIVSGTNAGDVYLSSDGAALTNGVPDAQSTYIYSIHAGENVGAIINMCVSPSDSQMMYPNYVLFSIANDATVIVEIIFQLKSATSTNWGTEFKFYVNDRANTQFWWRLDGVPPIDNTTGIDVRLRARRTGGAGIADVSGAISIKSY